MREIFYAIVGMLISIGVIILIGFIIYRVISAIFKKKPGDQKQVKRNSLLLSSVLSPVIYILLTILWINSIGNFPENKFKWE